MGGASLLPPPQARLHDVLYDTLSRIHRGTLDHSHRGKPFTELDTAFLWASAPMLLSSFAAYLIMKRIGILK